jgi:YggT family protein
MIYTLVGLVDLLLAIVFWVILIQVILSWLVIFNVLNTRSAGVRAFINGIDRVTEPIYRPLRRILPNIGAIDIAPLVVVIIIFFLRQYLLPGILMETGPTIT